MKLAIMQPYIFPYIGYFQLINSVDKIVLYDDVNFIKGGWINRNRILINGSPALFTVPLENSSAFKTINQTKINKKYYAIWKVKFYKTLEQNYKQAPYYKEAIHIVSEVLDKNQENISALCADGIKKISDYLSITTEIVHSSAIYKNSNLKSTERVLDICKQEGATDYVNAIGGMELYSKEKFAGNGINLTFIQSDPILYSQFNYPFVSSLSVIDVLMFNSGNTIKDFIKNYQLI